MFTPRVQNAQTDLLVQAMLSLDSEEEAYRFFEDVCTIAEFKSISQRLEVAVLLRQGVTYQEIVKRTGASSTTISRVNRALLYGADGYHRVLAAMALPLDAQDHALLYQHAVVRFCHRHVPAIWKESPFRFLSHYVLRRS